MPVNTILGLFAKSPIKPLQEHIDKVQCCAMHLLPFFQAVSAGDWVQVEAVRADISRIEREADSLKRQIRLGLPRGLFMPVERTDLLELLTQQDKIANLTKDIAGRVTGRHLSIPKEIQADFNAYLSRCLDATALAKEAINELDELLEAGFKGREVNLVENMIQRLDEVENDTDVLQRQLRSSMQAVEHNYNPIDVMFIYKIIEWVGDLADQSERVGARLELMLARS